MSHGRRAAKESHSHAATAGGETEGGNGEDLGLSVPLSVGGELECEQDEICVTCCHVSPEHGLAGCGSGTRLFGRFEGRALRIFRQHYRGVPFKKK